MSLALGLAATGPAQAAQKPIDITGYKVSDLVVSSAKCQTPLVTAKFKKRSDVTYSAMSADIMRRGSQEGSVDFTTERTQERAWVCPQVDGLGVYSLGPTDIAATVRLKKYDWGWDSTVHNYVDGTKTNFNVRGKTKSSLSATRKGKKVTLTAKATVFSPENDRHINYNPQNAKLQVKSGKTWKNVRTLKLKKGKASVTLSDGKRKTYRVVTPQASWATATTTATVTK